MGSININSLIASLPRLDGTNYHDWKFNMQMILRRSGSWNVVSGKESEPEEDSKESKFAWSHRLVGGADVTSRKRRERITFLPKNKQTSLHVNEMIISRRVTYPSINTGA